MQKYINAVQIILSEQKQIIGPLALDLAKQAQGIKFIDEQSVEFEADPKSALGNLILMYQTVFGKSSVEVCRNALLRTNLGFTPEELPDVLRK